MCGLTGVFDSAGRLAGAELGSLVQAMADQLTHRGPDDAGIWADAERGIALGHRRLSIIDLSPAGHQPMVSSSGRTVMVYNGEVYSYREMRRELAAEGIDFRGDSDSEVILEAFERWGIERTLERMIGMFAIALWDRHTSSLTLIRDRLGIKPLYWGDVGRAFIFGSELKALTAFPHWRPTLNRDAIASFMRHNYIQGPQSIYTQVQKLAPGSFVTLRAGQPPQHTNYWNFRKLAPALSSSRDDVDARSAEASLDELLRDAIKRRMVADVPLGALLSGGIDSSLVAALMQAQSDRPIRTYSIGFAEDQFNEAPFAAAVASHLGTDHTELYVAPEHALEIVPKLPTWYDEPFADASQVPTYLVCELIRQHVTVALSGDGGDELFAGYNRYVYGQRIWNRIRSLPQGLRSALASIIRNTPEATLDQLARLIPRRSRPNQFGHKAHKVANGMTWRDPDALYRQLLTHWDDPELLVPGSTEPKGDLWNSSYQQLLPNFTERMQFFDTITYLPDDILTKVDRASMAVSLEARVPLLDHRVVEYAWRLPMHMKLHRGESKVLLRRILERYVPRHLIDRPKMGFGIPLDAWLRGPLRDWAEHLLDERRLRQQGLLEPTPIRETWAAHLAGKNWSYPLWDVLMLQAWLDANPWQLQD